MPPMTVAATIETHEARRARYRNRDQREHDLSLPMLLPAIRINTGPTDFFPIEQTQLARVDGEHWGLFGELFDASRK
jgi:branched-chain amino acid transport system substrate-binding protein